MPTSSRLATRPRNETRPSVGSVIRLKIFSNVLLPAPLRPMMPRTSPCLTSKLTSPQRPEFLDFIPLDHLASANDVDRFARKVADLAPDDVAQRRVLVFSLEESWCPIRYRLDRFSTTIAFSDMAAKLRSNQVREAFFGLSELMYSKPKKKSNHGAYSPISLARYSSLCPRSMHHRNPSITPTMGLSEYSNRHCSGTTLELNPTGDT